MPKERAQWFPFYFNDYQQDAQELSLTQHGAYLQLMLWYYATARPIPADRERIYRRVRAESFEEKQAVDFVLTEFFELRQTHWHHSRIDAEIASSTERMNRAKVAAQQRWEKKSQQNNGSRDAPALFEHMGEQCQHNTTQHKEKSKALSPTNGDASQRPAEIAKRVLSFLNTRTHRNFPAVESNLSMIRARLSEGFTEMQMRKVIARQCIEWSGDEKMAKYLRPKTLFNKTNFANYVGELVLVTDDGGKS